MNEEEDEGIKWGKVFLYFWNEFLKKISEERIDNNFVLVFTLILLLILIFSIIKCLRKNISITITYNVDKKETKNKDKLEESINRIEKINDTLSEQLIKVSYLLERKKMKKIRRKKRINFIEKNKE